MKKFLSLSLALIMLFALIPTALSASAETVTKTLYSWEDEDLTGISTNMTKSISTSVAYDGSKSIKIKPNTALWSNIGNAVTSSNFKNYIRFVIPEGLNITGKVGFYYYTAAASNSAYEAIGVKMANGDKYFTKFANLGTKEKWINLVITGRTYYNYDNTATKLTVKTENFAPTASDDTRVTGIYLVKGGSKDDWAHGFVDNVYYETEVADKAPTTDAVSTLDEASIRLNSPNGIRFYTTVDEAKLAELVGENTYEIGTLIAPADALGEDGELTEADDCLNVIYQARDEEGNIDYYTDNTGFSGIVGSIVNIRETDNGDGDTNGNIDRAFAGRAYVKVGDTYYFSATTSTRSLAQVAYAYKNSESYVANEKVEQWAAEYVA